jgi:hypothetical protein
VRPSISLYIDSTIAASVSRSAQLVGSSRIRIGASFKALKRARHTDTLRLTAAYSGGWSVRDAGEVTTRFGRYRDYVACSRGELSAAKHAYVATHSGWFSDRSVCYLAAGRPVILQDTGFGQSLPTGRGLLAFSTLAEARDCIERVNADYQAHCSAARQLASDFLHFQKVLGPVLEIALST